jgi:hypothetical protein
MDQVISEGRKGRLRSVGPSRNEAIAYSLHPVNANSCVHRDCPGFSARVKEGRLGVGLVRTKTLHMHHQVQWPELEGQQRGAMEQAAQHREGRVKQYPFNHL